MAGWLWLIGGVVLLGGELLGAELVLAMLAVGAFAAAVPAWLGADLWVQVGAFAVVSVGLIVFARPPLRRLVHTTPGVPRYLDTLAGKDALVVASMGAHEHTGRVRVDGQEWTARPAVPGQAFAAGTQVYVLEVDGATLVVTDLP